MMPQYISARPTFHLKDLCAKKQNVSTFPLDHQRCYFFFSARYALAAGIKALGMRPNDTVLLPSYNCGTEIDPFLHLSIKPVFYRVNKELLLDFDDLLGKVTDRTKAIFVTHFLGFPQPIDEIKEICIQKNLYLIEDCAHAFLSMNKNSFLGSYGDIAIFSIRKTLPIPEGGVLFINRNNIKGNHNDLKPIKFLTYYCAAELLRYRSDSNHNSIRENVEKYFYYVLYATLLYTRLILRGYRKLCNGKGLYLVRPDSYLFIEDLCSWGIFQFIKKYNK